MSEISRNIEISEKCQKFPENSENFGICQINIPDIFRQICAIPDIETPDEIQ